MVNHVYSLVANHHVGGLDLAAQVLLTIRRKESEWVCEKIASNLTTITSGKVAVVDQPPSHLFVDVNGGGWFIERAAGEFSWVVDPIDLLSLRVKIISKCGLAAADEAVAMIWRMPKPKRKESRG